MPSRLESVLSRSDPRPILVSLLGGAWIVMGTFGMINGALLVGGLADGVEIGSYDPNAQLAEQYPEFVDPAWYEAQAKKASLQRIRRRAGVPLLGLALLALLGGVQLLRNRRRARTILALTGLGVLLLSAWQSREVYLLSLQTAQPVDIPEEGQTLLWSFAVANVAIQSLPLCVAVGLLRHPIVTRWVCPPTSAVG